MFQSAATEQAKACKKATEKQTVSRASCYIGTDTQPTCSSDSCPTSPERTQSCCLLTEQLATLLFEINSGQSRLLKKQGEALICIFLALFSVGCHCKLPGCFLHCFLSQFDSISKQCIRSLVVFPSKIKNLSWSHLRWITKLNCQPILPFEKCPSAVDTVHWLEIESAAYKWVLHDVLQGDFESLAHKPDTFTLSPAPAGHSNPTQPLTWT